MPIHPTPSGTRDVLPDEARELRAILDAIRGVVEARGYGEVMTPALEYEQVLARGDPAAAEPAYRLFDEEGNVLVLRSDMTIPIARVVSARYATAEPPLRFWYVAHAYRSVRPQRGQAREMPQAGIELVGAPGPDGTTEALTLLYAALEAAGLENYRIGLGDACLYPAILDAPACRRARGRRSCTSSPRATSSAWSVRSGLGLRRGARAARRAAVRAAGRTCSVPDGPAAEPSPGCARCSTRWRPTSRSV